MSCSSISGSPRLSSNRRAPAWLALGLLLVLAPAFAANGISARVSSDTLSLGQTLTLTLEATGDRSASPDLSPLDTDFDIIDRRSQHSLSMINGERYERYRLILVLRPRRAGALQIPAISFGDAATQPVALTVTGAAAEPPSPVGAEPAHPTSASVLLETAVDPPKAWVKQQVVLTAKVFMNAPILGAELHDPQLSGVTILPLGEDRYPASRNGQDYSVYERRYALFPQAPGFLKIPPLVFDGWSAAAPAPAAPANGYAGEAVHAESQPLRVQVLQAPDTDPKTDWLPARSVALTETGSQVYQTTAGQPLTRQITLRVDGIKAADLPALALESPGQLGRRSAPPLLWDERRPEGVVGVRQETVTLTADEPGHYRLPSFSLRWWNTKRGGWENAVLPARDLVVTADDLSQPQASSPSAGSTLSAATPSAVVPSSAEKRVTAAEAAPPPTRSWGPWRWTTLALTLAWILTMIAWWRGRGRSKPPRETAVTPPTGPPVQPTAEDQPTETIAAVRDAYESDNPGAAREALLAWAKGVFPENPPSNLARLAQRCNEPLRGQILMLEQAFFSPRPLPWSLQPVWQHLDPFEPAPPDEPATFRRGKPLRRRASA
jgi:hypothetical protein